MQADVMVVQPWAFETIVLAVLLEQEKGIGPTTLIRMWVLERLGKNAADRV